MAFITGWSYCGDGFIVSTYTLQINYELTCKIKQFFMFSLSEMGVFLGPKSSVNVSFFISGHKRDGAHGEARLAKCHDLCHSHLQVLWDLTSPSLSTPLCYCSTIRATQALISSQQPLNPHGQLLYLTDLALTPTPQQHAVMLHAVPQYSAALKADHNLTGHTQLLPVHRRRRFV